MPAVTHALAHARPCACLSSPCLPLRMPTLARPCTCPPSPYPSSPVPALACARPRMCPPSHMPTLAHGYPGHAHAEWWRRRAVCGIGHAGCAPHSAQCAAQSVACGVWRVACGVHGARCAVHRCSTEAVHGAVCHACAASACGGRTRSVPRDVVRFRAVYACVPPCTHVKASTHQC